MAYVQETQYALLVPWGHSVREIGLLAGLETIQLNRKVYEHTPQAKVIEFLVAILSGAKYLKITAWRRIHWTRMEPSRTGLGADKLGRL